MQGTLSILDKYEPRSLHHELPIIWRNAIDCWVWDDKNNKYLDFTSGIFVANIGHSRPEVKRAINGILSQDLLHNYAFPSEIRAELVKKLCEMTEFEKCYLCTTGSEAMEAALRIMKAHCGSIWGVYGAFHGHTWGSAHEIKRMLHYGVAPMDENLGIVFESYSGYNAQFHPKEWTQKWCDYQHEHNGLVCFDEVQAGFGRTGKLFGYEHYEVKPDLIVVGKALGGGLPISAVLGSAKLLDAPGTLTSTHTGNPVCCAAALATLNIIKKEQLVRRAEVLGLMVESVIFDLFHYEVNGKGLVWGIDLKNKDFANRVVDKCAEKGLLLVKTHRGTIKIGPPLIIELDDLMKGLEIIKHVIDEG